MTTNIAMNNKYPTTEVCTVSNYQPLVPSYTQAISTSVLQVIRLVQLLLALALLGVAFVLWFWSISFQTGRLLRRWIIIEKPTPPEVIYKLGEILVFPIVALADWSRRAVNDIWGIQLPLLSETKPPKRCSDLLTQGEPDSSASA
jgi:hypothetical protein